MKRRYAQMKNHKVYVFIVIKYVKRYQLSNDSRYDTSHSQFMWEEA